MVFDELEIIWHNGGTGGYRTFAGFVKGGKKGVVVLSNSNAGVDDIGIHLLNPKFPLKVIEPIPEEIVVDHMVLESYVGKYELMPNFILTISNDDNQLKAQAKGQPDVPVFPKSENIFFYKVVEAQRTFNKNESGKVESITLHQAGQKLVGKKLE
ncbi:MAG: DUF3471 domain-containing protein [Cyclobacteriaceae bacterium]|jgi:serine-type D-Ala-D-Ala carboxypeptidase/endopeptidase|nr:DUF3471 domain-containing protein [Cyclobacteriaceae bacterium]